MLHAKRQGHDGRAQASGGRGSAAVGAGSAARGRLIPQSHMHSFTESQGSSDHLRILAAPGDVIGRVGGRLPRTTPPSISDRVS